MDPTALTGGLATAMIGLLVAAVRMILRGTLVPKSHLEDRIKDRDMIIATQAATLVAKDDHIATLDSQLQLARIGNQTTLRVVEALPSVAGATEQVEPT